MLATTPAAGFRAFAPGPLLGQRADNATATTSPVTTPSSTRVQPTKLFIGGISRRTTTKQLRDHFCQGGRVLDCVAMRTPDGRPRGFGYVTLDSPAAAHFFLAEPQMIDDRFVDLKLAVPEEPASKAAGSKPTSPTNFGMLNQDYFSQSSLFYSWPEASGMYAGTGGIDWQQSAASTPTSDCLIFDCLDVLSAATSEPSGQWEAWTEKTPQAPTITSTKPVASSKQPLGEVTNLLSTQEPIPAKKAATPTSFAEHIKAKPFEPARIPVSASLMNASKEDFSIFEDSTGPASPEKVKSSSDDQVAADYGPPGTMSARAPTATDAGETNSDPAALEDLPLHGSSLHELGAQVQTAPLLRGPPGLSLPKSEETASPQPAAGNVLPDTASAPPGCFFRTSAPREPVLSTAPVEASDQVTPTCLLSTTPFSTMLLPPAKAVAKEFCTVATQTDDDFCCPHCAKFTPVSASCSKC